MVDKTKEGYVTEVRGIMDRVRKMQEGSQLG
jgi:hypothetical protein